MLSTSRTLPGMVTLLLWTLSSTNTQLLLVNGWSIMLSRPSRRNGCQNRRDVCLQELPLLLWGATLLPNDIVGWAFEGGNDETSALSNINKKPSAPVELLLPATRVKLTIDQALKIAQSSSSIADSNNKWTQLESLLLKPQNYTRQQFANVPTAPAQAYLDTYQRNRQELNILQKPGALLLQSGEISAWKRLKRDERKLEEQDEIRAALNLYTSALTFSAESYLLKVPPQQRSQMIRNNQLPDVKQVIQSDMGVRYLLRNQLLTAMEEVRGELEYQLALMDLEKRSVEELVPLLQQAQSACQQWFDLIDENDVQAAIRVVQQEQP